MHVLLEVRLQEGFLNLKLFGVLFGNRRNGCDAAVAGSFQRIDDARIGEAVANGPKCKYEWQSGKESPALRQIEHFEWLRAQAQNRFLPINVGEIIIFHEFERVIADK